MSLEVEELEMAAMYELRVWPGLFQQLQTGGTITGPARGWLVDEVVWLREWLPDQLMYSGAEVRLVIRRVTMVYAYGHRWQRVRLVSYA